MLPRQTPRLKDWSLDSAIAKMPLQSLDCTKYIILAGTLLFVFPCISLWFQALFVSTSALAFLEMEANTTMVAGDIKDSTRSNTSSGRSSNVLFSIVVCAMYFEPDKRIAYAA